MPARLYPWSTLSKVTREDVSAAAALHRWENAFVPTESVARALAGLLEARVELRVGRVGISSAARGVGDGIGVLLASEGAPDAGQAALISMEPALGVALAARALRRGGPKLVDRRTTVESLPGAVAAIVAAAARRVHAGRAIRVLAAGPRRVVEGDLLPAGREMIEANLTVLFDDEAFAAQILLPAAIARTAPLPRWTLDDVAALGDLPIALPIVAAVSHSTVGEVGILRRGDAWVPRGWGVRFSPEGGVEGSVLLAAAGAERGIGALLGEGARLVVRNGGEPLGWTPMQTEDGVGEGEIDGAALAEAIGEVPVVVRVEVGIAEMRAREWASLAPGDVVALGRKIGDAVTLRVGGVTVARGELVDLDGEVAVRILGRVSDDSRTAGQERA